MGMAASQARYLTLSARKTNVEYEGQQINQARTSLANQSANLFNQMLSMEVPTPPSTTDFTTVQYSFSDGVNTSVLSNYYQLGKADTDYNYVVTTYHNEKVYTGSRKKLNDPQVQATATHNYSYDIAAKDNNQQKTVTKAWKDADGTYGIEATDGSTSIFRPVVVKDEDMAKAINYGKGNGTVTAGQSVALTNPEVKAGFSECTNSDLEAIKKCFTGATDPTQYYKNAEGIFITKAEYNATPPADITDGVKFEATGVENPATLYTDGKQFVTKTDLDSAVTKYDNYIATGKKEPNSINIMTVSDDPTFSNYTAVGNCPLKELTESDMKDQDIKAEIDQVIKDMQREGGDKIAAEHLAACFETDPATGETRYKGGIFQFTMGGTTYYTTKDDLDASLRTSIVDNKIDVQQDKLRYYNAVYLDTKVEETQKALLETDGKGRFSSLKLENDSTKYILNTETVTDEAAYNDAMNQYYYKNAEYEKALADINAKTEAIQAQDRTLELRLEQLNTEQSALQNEMEAVKKVVDKHVEQGFKTFGG